MNSVGARAWTAALALIGVPFRLHGRDAATGLDCVGLVAVAYDRAGWRVAGLPDRYRLRDTALADAQRWLGDAGLCDCRGAAPAIGDVVLCDMGQGQWHLMLGGVMAGGATATLHAHAGLRRVVLMPGDPPGRLVGRYRIATPVGEAAG